MDTVKRRLSTPATNNVVTQGKSRYTQGGQSECYSKRTGWWERYNLDQREDDIRFTVTPSNQFRPDLIAYTVYSSVRLMWIVLQYNNIVDPQTELTTGTTIRLPAVQRVHLDLLNKSTGGTFIEK